MNIEDVALVDAIAGYCAQARISASALSDRTFIEVVALLSDTCQKHSRWVWASQEIRRYYPVCHFDCHLNRVAAFMARDCKWEDGEGPNSKGVVIPFPTNHTKH